MNLRMPGHLAREYKSAAQQARVVSEAWGEQNLFCPNCTSPNVARSPHGTKAVDFTCPRCDAPYQLKSASHPFGGRIVDAAYDAMRSAVEDGRTPNLLALHYDPNAWVVRNLFLIPKFAFSLSCLEKRSPLGPLARRAGWIGCNILLTSIPPDAKIHIVSGGLACTPVAVRRQYARLRPLGKTKHDARGWTLDVLNIVRRLPKFRGSGFGTRDSAKGRAALTMSQAVGAGLETRPYEFTLDEVYAFADELARLHPQNKNVEPKIRQQLQILRDMGLVEFIGRGRYRVSGMGTRDSGLGRGNA